MFIFVVGALYGMKAQETTDYEVINGLYYHFDHENMTAEVCPMDYNRNKPDRQDYVGNIVIPEQVVYDGETYTVTSLGEYVFARCNSLTSVTIPNSVTKIGDYAFHRTTVQGSVTIPNSVTSISEEAFQECDIHDLYIDCTDIATQIFHSVAWRYSAKVNHLIIGENVKQIASDAFIHCMIENITCLAATPPYLDRMIGGLSTRWNGATVVKTNLPPLEVKRGKTLAYADAPVWSTFETIYAQQDGKRYYPIKATSDKILIEGEPGGAELCEGSEFTISVAEDLDLKKSVVIFYETDITDSLMANGQYRQTVRPLTTIQNKVYCDDYSAKTLDITLEGSGRLASKISMGGLQEVEGLILHGELNGTDFQTINKMENLCILNMADARIVSGGDPYRVETYEVDDEEVVVNYVTEDDVAGSDLLKGTRRKLQRLILPKTLRSIDSYAFESHQALRSVTVPSTVQTMNEGAFAVCSRLTTVRIPQGCTQIPKNAYGACYGLKNVIIPGSITDIGERAFSGCDSIGDIKVYRATPPSLKSNAFLDNVKETATLHVPRGHKNDYKSDVHWKKFLNIVDDIDIGGVESIPTVEGMVTSIADGIYDLQGRRVPSLTSSHSSLKKGIYIENGRKRVVR